MFKLKNSSAIAFIGNEETNDPRSLVRVRITNTNILTNYFIPFLNNMKFITKKREDFNDFKIICNAIYNGVHRNEEIKSLILKLSYTMNNYRLSNNSEPEKISRPPAVVRFATPLSKESIDRIINAKPTITHLSDGRQLDNETKKVVNRRWNNCVFEITKNNGEINLASTLDDAAKILNVDFRTVRKHLDSSSGQQNGFAIIKDNKIIRVAVFYR